MLETWTPAVTQLIHPVVQTGYSGWSAVGTSVCCSSAREQGREAEPEDLVARSSSKSLAVDVSDSTDVSTGSGSSPSPRSTRRRT
jgi:hypothetical protein